MEPFVDFGLFEFLAASGLVWLGRRIYATRITGLGLLILSVAAPAALVVVSPGGLGRWVAVICLSSSVVNSAVLLPLLMRGRLL